MTIAKLCLCVGAALLYAVPLANCEDPDLSKLRLKCDVVSRVKGDRVVLIVAITGNAEQSYNFYCDRVHTKIPKLGDEWVDKSRWLARNAFIKRDEKLPRNIGSIDYPVYQIVQLEAVKPEAIKDKYSFDIVWPVYLLDETTETYRLLATIKGSAEIELLKPTKEGIETHRAELVKWATTNQGPDQLLALAVAIEATNLPEYVEPACIVAAKMPHLTTPMVRWIFGVLGNGTFDVLAKFVRRHPVSDPVMWAYVLDNEATRERLPASVWEPLLVECDPLLKVSLAAELSSRLTKAQIDRALKQAESIRPVIEKEKIKGLLRDLDHDQFRVREKAKAEIMSFQERALPFLRDEIADKPSAEAQARLREMIQALGAPVKEDAQSRLVGQLERDAKESPLAHQLLIALSKNDPEARITQLAEKALERIKAAK